MKEQSVILPPLPIVGALKLTSQDGKSLKAIHVVEAQKASDLDSFFLNCYHELKQFLEGHSLEMNIPLDLSGLSPFQITVLKAMKEIPYGRVASYRDLAFRMNSRAYQAIGSACGRNPLMLIYPCHRVVGSKDLGGFAHGLVMKKALLTLEGAF